MKPKTVALLFICSFLFACSNKPNPDDQLINLIEKNMEFINGISLDCFWGIESSYNENRKKVGPYYKKAIEINQITNELLSKINDYNKSTDNNKFKELKLLYNETIDTLLTYNSFDFYSIDTNEILTINESGILSLLHMKFNIVNLKYHLLRYFFTSIDNTYCGFTPFEVSVNELQNEKGHHLILESEFFQASTKKYVEIDSIFKNRIPVSNELIAVNIYPFSSINLDSLSQGKYQIFGKVFTYSDYDDHKIEEHFDYQFVKK